MRIIIVKVQAIYEAGRVPGVVLLGNAIRRTTVGQPQDVESY
ncbi:hypothetical protein [Cerasicoccus frondis]|nr:hypothetical protein [Cerasicoccus frondis]